MGASDRRGLTRRSVAWLLLTVVALALGWASRHALLAKAGGLLISEDPLERAEVIVVSTADPLATALEAGQLYREGLAGEVVVPVWKLRPVVTAVRELGISYPGPAELATSILERSGVPPTAIRVLADPVDGTDTEIAAVAAFAKRWRPTSLLFVTARDHTARARWLLRREMPSETRLLVRAPRTDPFDADSWWHSRDLSREVVAEYLRWFNTLILRDPWSRNGKGVGSRQEGREENQKAKVARQRAKRAVGIILARHWAAQSDEDRPRVPHFLSAAL